MNIPNTFYVPYQTHASTIARKTKALPRSALDNSVVICPARAVLDSQDLRED